MCAVAGEAWHWTARTLHIPPSIFNTTQIVSPVLGEAHSHVSEKGRHAPPQTQTHLGFGRVAGNGYTCVCPTHSCQINYLKPCYTPDHIYEMACSDIAPIFGTGSRRLWSRLVRTRNICLQEQLVSRHELLPGDYRNRYLCCSSFVFAPVAARRSIQRDWYA